jgi:starch-binding outer membrane protein SusE/F
MKRLSIIIFLIGLVGLFSCKKDETKATLQTPVNPVLNLSVDSMTLLKNYADSMITFTWSSASFGQTLVTTYTLQVDKQGDSFKTPLAIGSVTAVNSLTIVTKDLNNKFLGLEFNPDLRPPTPLNLEFRIMASVSSLATPAYSAVISKVVTPYYVKIVYPLLFVPGNYQGWNPADSTTVIYSAKSNLIYDGYVWMSSSAPQYKYCDGPSWTTNYGDNGGTGVLAAGGNNITPSTGPGYYHLKVDLSGATKTHTYLLTNWSVIGDATPGGWNTDTDMAFDTISKLWSVNVALTAANIKFRANHVWDLNYGDTGADGSLDMNGDNIAVAEAGNYTVTLNLTGAIYRYKLQKN